MTFDTFWDLLKKGGKTPEGDRFSITKDDRLHILSPRNKNKKYRIKHDKARQYFEKDIPKMGEKTFRYRRSWYFYNIYRHVLR